MEKLFDKIAKTKVCDKLKYCYVNEQKLPFNKNGEIGKSNNENDFSFFNELKSNPQTKFSDKALGFSVNFSNICAIDVDHCFEVPNDITTASELAKNILDYFNDCYCEFSFSGKGLRILFQASPIKDYKLDYYIKNSTNGIEYYFPQSTYRYCTLTGNFIYNNFAVVEEERLINFLNKYMKRKFYSSSAPSVQKVVKEETKILCKRNLYFNIPFQNKWFDIATGSGTNESEKDFSFLSTIYNSVTQNKAQAKEIFEMSPYFKSKDYKHKSKWEYGDFRYFNYMWLIISGGKQ